jgi:cobyrinic acid a,c-diamide synthase
VTGRTPVPIAIARDAAFCFYYADNIDLLREAGAEIRYVSPLAGQAVPPDASGLYLGGGYPELFAEQLSSHTAVLESIRLAASRGMPVYAECGGLMFLGRDIETVDGTRYPMVGILPFSTRMLKRRRSSSFIRAFWERRGCGCAGTSFTIPRSYRGRKSAEMRAGEGKIQSRFMC